MKAVIKNRDELFRTPTMAYNILYDDKLTQVLSRKEPTIYKLIVYSPKVDDTLTTTLYILRKALLSDKPKWHKRFDLISQQFKLKHTMHVDSWT